MLQPTRTKSLGDLYYNDEDVQYVAPPIAARKELMDAKEEDYLLTKSTMNEVDKILRTMPRLEHSSPVYNQLKDKVNGALGSINAENYSDSVLDVQQVANDYLNKWGGNEIVKEASLMQDQLATYDKAFEKGDIKDPNVVAWLKSETLKGHKGLTIDENGYVSQPKVSGAGYAKHFDVAKYNNDILTGWQSDGTVLRDPETGQLRLTRPIPGIIGITEYEHASADDIKAAAIKLMQNNPEAKAYIDFMAKYNTKDIPVTAETLMSLSPKLGEVHNERLFGKKNPTLGDIQLAISEGLNPKAIIESVAQFDTMLEQGDIMGSKFGFSKEKLTTLKDEFLFKTLDAEAARRKAGAEAKATNALVTVQSFTAGSDFNPANIEQLSIVKNDLVKQREDFQMEINSYREAIKADPTAYTPDQMTRLEARQKQIDEEIAEVEKQENSIHKAILDAGIKADVNLPNLYTTELTNSANAVLTANFNTIQSATVSDFTVDVSSMVYTKNGKEYVKAGRGDNFMGKQDMPLEEFSNVIKKEGGKYVYTRSRGSGIGENLWKNFKSLMFKQDGSINKNTTKFANPEQEKLLYRVPNEKEFNNMVIKAYGDKESPTNVVGQNKNVYTDEQNKLMFSGKLLESVQKIRDRQGDIPLNVTTPLQYLMVEGEGAKDEVKILQNLITTTKRSFQANQEQYQVRNKENKLVPIADYIKEEYNVNSDNIDWKNSDIEILTDTDRVHGQKYGIAIKLTKDGQKVADGHEDMRTSGIIKLVGVNTVKDVKNEQAEIRHVMTKAFPYINGGGEHNENLMRELGLLYANNSSIGNDLDRKNLYTMGAGNYETFQAPDGEYKISTTAKTAIGSDLLNVNFHLGKIVNNKDVYLGTKYTPATADTPAKTETGYYTDEELKDKNIQRVVFETPSDIKALIGANMLRNEVKRNQVTDIGNPYAEFLQSSGYRVTANSVTATNYSSIVKKVRNQSNGETYYSNLYNNITGQVERVKTRFNPDDVTPLTGKIQVAQNVQYPVVNKDIEANVVNLALNNGLTLTGGARGEDTHNGLAEASDDSLHKHGYGLDFRYDENGRAFFDKVANNPAEREKYGILKVLKHDVNGTVHVHVEFMPKSI